MSKTTSAAISLFALAGACGAPLAPPQSLIPVAIAGSIAISEPRVRLPVAGQDMTAAYLTLTNEGAQSDQLVGASSPNAGAVELHAHIKTGDGMMSMRKIRQIDVPGDTTIPLSPGGLHIMLKQVQPGLKLGDTLALNLTFSSGAKASFRVPVVVNPALHQNTPKSDKGAHQH